MKLVVAIVQDRDSHHLLEALTKAGHRSTRLASTGGFLREGNTTLLIGTTEDKVDEILTLIRRTCQSREQVMAPLSPVAGGAEAFIPYPVTVQVGGATVFVLNVENFERT